MSMIVRVGSHVCPPSVLRDMPTSMSPGKSPPLRWRRSYTAINVPFGVVANPGMLPTQSYRHSQTMRWRNRLHVLYHWKT